MPTPRRRKFSVQNDLGNKNNRSVGTFDRVSTSSTTAEGDLKPGISQNLIPPKPSNNYLNSKSSEEKTKTQQNIRDKITNERQSVHRIAVDLDHGKSTCDKNVYACPSSTDTNLSNTTVLYQSDSETKSNKTRETSYSRGREKPLPRDTTFNRQLLHRAKVRSPKRRVTESQVMTINLERCDTSTSSSNLIQEIEKEVISEDITVSGAVGILGSNPFAIELSSHSIGDMCRICHGGESLTAEFGPLISACSCRGSVGRVHVKCLERWLTESGKSRCELCGTRYMTRRVHRYGVPRALLMWIMSQNAKQLMVDSLGIMLMSPLAVLAAWLSGQTLAGLMKPDAQDAPWPLASTFVLACMTLVCYYCWIVSAATRHALGWWLWYRSQYEVRLEI